MDIPRGHAMLPLNDFDFLDFIYNYFKAEYAPIRSFFSTATATPLQPERWISMGHELSPLTFRAANAQAQKDLESLDYFTRRWNLDVGFVRGLVIRFAKYEVHERLEKKLFESCRLDLMVRKALKEKHLIDALWPSPAPKNIEKAFLQQGVQVRSWYGDMFGKYFRHLHAIDDFKLRPEVQARIGSSQTLMLVPFVDHLVFGAVDPIVPIIAKGAGYANVAAWKQKDGGLAFGEPDRFDIRFDAPADLSDTVTKSVVRQCKCLKCGAKRDVKIVISVDPLPGSVTSQSTTRERRPSSSNTSARRHASKAAQRYSPGYSLPRNGEVPTKPPSPHQHSQEARVPSPEQKKQCPRCTFLNHPELTSCEMCSADLPDTVVSKSPSPVTTKSKISHAQSASVPSAARSSKQEPSGAARPSAPNRHSLSSTLFSIFPFSQQQQTEHHPNLPPTQPSEAPTKRQTVLPRSKEESHPPTRTEHIPAAPDTESANEPPRFHPSTPPDLIDVQEEREPVFNQTPEMAMMPMTPPPTSSHQSHHLPTGLPQNLMDDFVPVSPSYRHEEEEEDAGWGEMSREEARNDDVDEEEEDTVGRTEGLIDLDEVAREEMGVWGDQDEQ